MNAYFLERYNKMIQKNNSSANYQDVLDFWFSTENKPKWFYKSEDFDKLITQKFNNLYQDATLGLLDYWQDSISGTLALIIIFDQFSRNMFRGDPQSFAADFKALSLTKQALLKEMDKTLDADQKLFLYMPLMHSESLKDQELCVQLLEKDSQDTKYAKMHLEIIKKIWKIPSSQYRVRQKIH